MAKKGGAKPIVTKKRGKGGILGDLRFIALLVVIFASIAAIALFNPSISPIDNYMQSKGGGIRQIKNTLSGNEGGVGTAPKDSYEVMGEQAGTLFAYVKPEHLQSKSMMRAIGAAACSQSKSPSYCEIYFWAKKEDVVVKLPVRRDGSLTAFYENKNGKAALKLMP